MIENEWVACNAEPSGIGIECIICGETRELTQAEAAHYNYFGTVASIYICDECKEAVKFAKWLRTGRVKNEGE